MDNQRYLLSFMNLFGYLQALPTSRCIIEGEAIVNACHIITCGLLEKTSKIIKIFALCLKTSALQEKPHEIRGEFQIMNSTVEVQHFKCTCKAGLSKRCKHVAAVLILCTRENILNFPIISSTDVKCYWNRTQATGNYTAAPILDHKCFKIQVTSQVKSIKQINNNDVISMFTSALPNSALAKHIKRRRLIRDNIESDANSIDSLKLILENAEGGLLKNLASIQIMPECCRKTYEAICSVDIATVATETKENRSLWFKERQFRITGSRCYSIYTYSLNDWETKSRKYFWPKGFRSKCTDHGHQFEAVARSAYKASNNCEVIETGLIISKYHPWLAYSPDGIIIEDKKPVKLLEIKCPYAGANMTSTACIETCTYLLRQEGNVLLKKKHSYYAQVQLGLSILNLKECDLIIYSSFDSSFIKIVRYDEPYILDLIYKLQHRYIQNMLHIICTNKD